MALTHQIAIQAAEGWSEINLAMDLLPLAAHQITLALARGNSTEDHCISRGATPVGATSLGTTQTGQLFTLGILRRTNIEPLKMEPLKLVMDIAIDLPAEIAITHGIEFFKTHSIEFFKTMLSIKEIKQTLANGLGRT